MVGDTMVTEELSAVGEAFLHEEAHTYYLRAGLTAEVDDAARCMTVGQEVVNEHDGGLCQSGKRGQRTPWSHRHA